MGLLLLEHDGSFERLLILCHSIYTFIIAQSQRSLVRLNVDGVHIYILTLAQAKK